MPRSSARVPFAVLGFTGAALAAGPPAERRDLHADQLPSGAVARMGTVRLRHGCPVTFARFLAKDRELASLGWDERVCLWDAGTGRLLRQFGRETTISNLGALVRNGGVTAWKVPGAGTFADVSPDRRFLATGHNNGFVRVWDLSTGKEVGRFTPAAGSPVWGLAFTSDGKGLVPIDRTSLIRLWDPFTSAEIRRFGGPTVRRHHRRMAVSPYGKLLAVADKDTPPDRIARLVKDLDSDDFATREKASREVEQAGFPAVVALRDVSRGATNLELRRRAERLLAVLEKQAMPPEDLRALRAVEVLEVIGTAESVRLLRRLADGARGARLTEEAKAALARLRTRK